MVSNLNDSVASLPSLTAYLNSLNSAAITYNSLPSDKAAMLTPVTNSIVNLNTSAFQVRHMLLLGQSDVRHLGLFVDSTALQAVLLWLSF